MLAGINVFWLLPGVMQADAAAWIVLAAVCILMARRDGRLPLLLTRMAGAWTLWPFVLFAGLTVFWSIAWQVSLSRWITLAAIVIVGA